MCTVAYKVHRLNFVMIHCLFRYSTGAAYIKLIVGLTLLFLRLHGEISLSLLCSHGSLGSALDLDPPLHVGRPLVSVLCPDRRGLKEWLIRSLMLGGLGTRYGTSLRWQRLA